MTVTVDLTGVDWKLLRIQKQSLVETMGNAGPLGDMFLEGIVALLDDIQDQAAEQIGEGKVFGKDSLDNSQ